MTEEARAEIAANIWHVQVARGALVTEGEHSGTRIDEDGTPLLSLASGTVREVAVEEGDAVREGGVVAIIGS